VNLSGAQAGEGCEISLNFRFARFIDYQMLYPLISINCWLWFKIIASIDFIIYSVKLKCII